MTTADDPVQTTVLQVLKQKCAMVEGSIGKLDDSRPEDTTSSKEQGRAKGRILTWRGLDIGYAWVRGPRISEITIYRYANGTSDARKLLHQDFGELTNVVDAVYFPLSANFPGVIVAVRELGGIRRSFLAYISLRSGLVLDYRYVAGDVTCIHSAIDGIGVERGDLRALASSFHSWPHVLVVGCKSSSAWLMHMNINAKDAALVEEKGVKAEKKEPSKEELTGSIPLLDKFIGRHGKFVVRDEVQGCLPYPADQVIVSALSYIDKSYLVVMGFNIGSVALVSLKSCMIEQVLLANGIIEFFAVQEPEEESRPMFYLWSTLRMETAKGRRLIAIMHVINFRQSDSTIPRELWSYDDPKMRFLFNWWIPQCDRMLVMRTVVKPRGRSSGERRDSSSTVWSRPGDNNAHETSQVLMVWLDELTSPAHPSIRGSLYDLNAHYAKRITPQVAEDGTIARQIPFFSLFKAAGLPSSQAPLDVVVTSTSHFAATASLREPTDQLFYASSFSIAANWLTSAALLEVRVQSLQQQLVVDIAANMPRYFDKPRPACQCAHSIGLVSSVPSVNLNEERVCLLRVLANYYFPGVLQLVDHLEDSEALKFVHKWVWKEVDIARDRLDELTSNILSHAASELSPAVTRFIHHSRVIFTRASMVLTALQTRIASKFQDDGWLRSITIQLQAVRQVNLYASGVSFALHSEMLPSKSGMIDAYKRCAEELTKRGVKLRARGKVSEVHAIVAELMRLHASDPVWGGKSSAEEWCASLNFVGLLPLLLFLDVSESAKLTLVGCYLLDLAQFLVKPVQKGIFDKAMSFLAQSEFSLNEPRRIRSLWENEKRLSKMDGAIQSTLRLLLGSEMRQDAEGGIASTPMRVPLYTPHPSVRANAPRPDETPVCAATTTPVPTPTPTPGTLRMKDWERINRVTRTPLSATKEASSTTPMLQHTLQPTPQPILKSPARKEGTSQATREVTVERPKRLQFAQVLSAVKAIPSRAQGRQEEGVNTSLTNFGYFSGTDQSSSTKQTPSSADASSVPMNSPRVAMAARAVEREVELHHSPKRKEPAEESHSPLRKRSKTASHTATHIESAEVEPPHLEEHEEGSHVEESQSPLRKRSETASHAAFVDAARVEPPYLERRKEPVEQNQSPLRTRSKTPSQSPRVDVPPSQSPPRRASKRIAERRARSANATPNAKDRGGVTKSKLSPTPTQTKQGRSVSASATKKQKNASPARMPPTAKGQKGRG